jgi:hypothetical protein
MQNSSPGQMLMLTTRIGEGSKMVITGDLKQSDRCADNGLLDIMNKIKAYKKNNEASIEMVEMKYSDIERSPIVSKILEIFNNKIVVDNDLQIQPVSKNTSTSIDDSIKRDNHNGDAALIPLTDISNRFNTNLIF